MIFDSHMHTEFSADSEMKAEDALAEAEKLGLGIVFTEHVDFEYPEEIDFHFSPEEYWKAYEGLRGSHLRLGVEIGMQEGLGERNAKFAQSVPFDEVIGSIHVMEGEDIYGQSLYENRSKEEIYTRYFRAMEHCVREHSFIDVLGHIDYIARYASYDNPEVQYGEYHEAIDNVLRAAVETSTVMELNTRRLASRLALKELVPVYKRYRELGGRYVTLGSDAHRTETIGKNFPAARDLAEACGLQVVTFRHRQIELCGEGA